jgi:hypothetical protein
MALLWSIWQQRNDKVWRDKVESFQHVRARTINLLTDWKDAQNHKNLHSQQRNSRIEFIRRHANEVAHVLARVATSLASFHLFIDVSLCICHHGVDFLLPNTPSHTASLIPLRNP